MSRRTKVNITLKTTLVSAMALAARAIAPLLKSQVLSDISKGVSPVRSQRFAKYSASYKKAIRGDSDRYKSKKLAPINLKLTGAMIKALLVEAIGQKIRIYWPSKVAAYHNEGTGKMPRRAVMPLTGEAFNEKILQIVTKAVKSALRKSR